MTAYEIRTGQAGEADAIARLYPAAFPEEDLLPLVRALLRETPGVSSLVAAGAPGVVGHAVFTPCGVSGGADTLALLGPVAVAPDWQRRGVGKALIQAGVERLRQAPVAGICVLGDPGYYGPLGFAPERAIAPPFPLPEGWREAWQSLFLNRASRVPAGQLRVPAAWRDPALWGA